MEFDKSKIYTALNADELPIGSKCIFADTIKDLKEEVKKKRIDTLFGIATEQYEYRFISEHGYKIQYALAYFIEQPAKPKYKPFSSVEKAMEAIREHDGWVGYKCRSFLVTAYDKMRPNHSVCLSDTWYSLQDLYKFFVFVNDGSPCGELVEE